MAKVEKVWYVCDRCGKTIDAGMPVHHLFRHRVYMGRIEAYDPNDTKGVKHLHLCKACWESFKHWRDGDGT